MTKRQYTLKIFPDMDPIDPREDDDSNPVTMVCCHDRYNLGDVQTDDFLSYLEGLCEQHDEGLTERIEDAAEAFWENHDISRISDHREWDEIRSDMVMEEFEQHYQWLPLYLYDHSGITMSTSPFQCPWDSGQVGIIYVPLDTTEFGSDADLIKILKLNVEEYDQYLRGKVYGFVLENIYGEELDSCWGFYGSDYKTNGIANHVDMDEVATIQWMEPEICTTMGVIEEEDLTV